MLKILMATDGSTDSLRAARFLPHLCAAEELKVTVLYVKDPYLFSVFSEGVITHADVHHADSVATEALTRTTVVLRQAGIEVEERAEWGEPAQVITETAQKEGFDLVIVGSRGLGGLAGLFVGSVSDRVLHRAHCPVLVVR